MGLDVWVVTGDNRRVAAALARRLGVSPHRVMSEVLPAEKARKVLFLYCSTRILYTILLMFMENMLSFFFSCIL